MRKCPLPGRMQALASAFLPAKQSPLPPSCGYLRKGPCHQPGPPEPGICSLPSLGQHGALPAPGTRDWLWRWSRFQNNGHEITWCGGRIRYSAASRVRVPGHTPTSRAAQASTSSFRKVLRTAPGCTVVRWPAAHAVTLWGVAADAAGGSETPAACFPRGPRSWEGDQEEPRLRDRSEAVPAERRKKGSLSGLARGETSLPSEQWRREPPSCLHSGLEGLPAGVLPNSPPLPHEPHCLPRAQAPIQMQTPGGAFALWPSTE